MPSNNAKLKSKFLDNIIKEEQQQKGNFERLKDEKIRMKEKKYSYAKYVKEIHWPDVS